MTTQSSFQELSSSTTLSDLIFIAQFITREEINIGNFQKNLLTARANSDVVLKKFPSLLFLKPFNKSVENSISANSLEISSFKFDGKNLSFDLKNSYAEDEDNERDFDATISFIANNLSVTIREYELNPETKMFEKVLDDVQENEHINDILEDFSNIYDIYFSSSNGTNTMSIFLLISELDDDFEGYVQILEVKFDFTSV